MEIAGISRGKSIIFANKNKAQARREGTSDEAFWEKYKCKQFFAC